MNFLPVILMCMKLSLPNNKYEVYIGMIEGEIFDIWELKQDVVLLRSELE